MIQTFFYFIVFRCMISTSNSGWNTSNPRSSIRSSFDDNASPSSFTFVGTKVRIFFTSLFLTPSHHQLLLLPHVLFRLELFFCPCCWSSVLKFSITDYRPDPDFYESDSNSRFLYRETPFERFEMIIWKEKDDYYANFSLFFFYNRGFIFH